MNKMKALVVGIGVETVIEILTQIDPKVRVVESVRGSSIATTDLIIIICYDVTSMESFEEVEKWLREVGRFNRRKKKILVGCHPDELSNTSHTSNKQEVETKMANSFADSCGLLFCEVSAKDGTNLEKILTQPQKQKDDDDTKIIIFCEVSATDGTNLEKILTQPEIQKNKSRCFI